MIISLKAKTLLCSLVVLGALISCNKNTQHYTATTINPELLGKWQSPDNCTLTLKKEHDELILVNYTHNKQQLLNIPLRFTPYSIATKLNTKNPTAPKFSATYIDGAIIITSCQILRKVN